MYELVTFPQLFTAPWMQVWGSIVGAALGAGLAVYGAVWFERRHALRQARNAADSARYVVRRVQVAMAKFREAWGGSNQAQHLQPSLTILWRTAQVLDRLCPFSEIDQPEVETHLTELTVLMQIFRTPAELVEGNIGALDLGSTTHNQFVRKLDEIDLLCRNILARMHRGTGAPT